MKVLVTIKTINAEKFSYIGVFPTTVDAVMDAMSGTYPIAKVTARALPASAPVLH